MLVGLVVGETNRRFFNALSVVRNAVHPIVRNDRFMDDQIGKLRGDQQLAQVRPFEAFRQPVLGRRGRGVMESSCTDFWQPIPVLRFEITSILHG